MPGTQAESINAQLLSLSEGNVLVSFLTQILFELSQKNYRSHWTPPHPRPNRVKKFTNSFVTDIEPKFSKNWTKIEQE